MVLSPFDICIHLLRLFYYRQAQADLLKLITEEKRQYIESVNDPVKSAQEVFDKIPEYQAKVRTIQNMMNSIKSRIAKLKARAIAVQTVAVKDAVAYKK